MMKKVSGNLFENIQLPFDHAELFTDLFTDNKVTIERIVSNGQTSPVEGWHNSDKKEWVVLLQGKADIQFENGKIKHLSKGDYLFIDKGEKHKVTYTSKSPECVWLAIHFY